MADRYGDLYDRMVAVMERLDPDEDIERRSERRAEIDQLEAGTLATAWFDVDATVTAYCCERSLPVPTDIEALVDLHVKAVDAWLPAARSLTLAAAPAAGDRQGVLRDASM
jgi:hypothetical protein